MRSKINYQDLYRENRYRVFLPDDKMILSLPDKHKYIIHKIYEILLFDKTVKDYAPLYAKFLMNILGRYRVPLQDLLDRGIIETDNNYIVSCKEERGKSKGYKLTPKFRNKRVIADYINDSIIIKNLWEHKEKIPKLKQHKFLYDNLHKLDIDNKNAKEFIRSIYDTEIYNSYLISIDYINEKKFFFKVDNIAGRVHNNVTNLSKDLRGFLRYGEKKLINIDICNSQPFLFNILIKMALNEKIVYDSLCIVYDSLCIESFNLFSLYNKPHNKVFPPYDLPNIDLNCFINNLKKYENLTSTGQFYNYLMNIAGIEDRPKFKKDFFGTVFFCKLNHNYKYEYRKLFEKEFPAVAMIIDYYKRKDYKELPITLQRVEADIMINKIIKRIAKEKPDMFALTIHDSILTIEKNVEYIKEIIFDEFEKNFNLKPSIKIE